MHFDEDQPVEIIDMGHANGGPIRVSLGLAINFGDVYHLINFHSFLKRVSVGGDFVPQLHCSSL